MKAPKQYRKKPVVIDAVQFPHGGKSQGDVARWIKRNGGEAHLYDGMVRQTEEPAEDGSYYYWRTMTIRTLEGYISARPGDYIIRGVQGEFYSCKPDIFDVTYEEAHDDDQ